MMFVMHPIYGIKVQIPAIDPASPEFLRLTSREQATIYHYQYGWSVPDIADEYGITEELAMEWLGLTPSLASRDAAA